MVTVTNKATPPRETKPKGRHPDKVLSAAFVRTAPPGRHGGRQRVVPLRPAERNPKLDSSAWSSGVGAASSGSAALRLVSLAEAREKALANRKLAREGGDPLAEKRRARGVPSFAEATARVVEQKQAGWRSPAQGRDWILTFERYAFPRIGKNAGLGGPRAADVLEIPRSHLAHEGGQPPGGCGSASARCLEWAVAMEFRIDNPCDRIDPVLGPTA